MKRTSVRSLLSRAKGSRAPEPANYLIACDSHGASDHRRLVAAIEQLGEATWCLDNVWLVSSTASAPDILDHLSWHLETGERLIVVLCGRVASSSGFDDELGEWLEKHF